MIAQDQLAAKNYPMECWINVYKFRNMEELVYGAQMTTREAAHRASLGLPTLKVTLLYRIHMRLK